MAAGKKVRSMGMGPAMVLCQVSGEELDRLFADPTLIEQFMEDVDARLAAPCDAA